MILFQITSVLDNFLPVVLCQHRGVLQRLNQCWNEGFAGTDSAQLVQQLVKICLQRAAAPYHCSFWDPSCVTYTQLLLFPPAQPGYSPLPSQAWICHCPWNLATLVWQGALGRAMYPTPMLTLLPEHGELQKEQESSALFYRLFPVWPAEKLTIQFVLGFCDSWAPANSITSLSTKTSLQLDFFSWMSPVTGYATTPKTQFLPHNQALKCFACFKAAHYNKNWMQFNQPW